MTVSTTIRKAGPFAGTGLVSSYPFAFKVFTDDDLLVIRTPTGGADVTLVLASDYTVTLNPDQDAVPGGSVVLSAALAVGFTLSIGSQVDSLQGLSLTNNGGFFPKAIEAALDKLDIQDQQQEETLSRAVRVPFGSGAIPDLPAPSAGSALVWNTLGTALENGTPGAAYDTLRSDLLGTGSGQGASQVGMEGAGTVAKALKGVVAVMQYGATGDGSTDDTANFQLAINAASGGTLIVNPGTYIVGSAGLDFSSFTGTVWCYGTLKAKGSTAVSDIVNMGAGHDISWKGGTIDFNQTSSSVESNPRSDHGFYMRDARDIKIDGVEFTNIRFGEVIYIDGTSSTSPSASNGSKRIKVSNCNCNAFVTSGVDLGAAVYIRSDFYSGTGGGTHIIASNGCKEADYTLDTSVAMARTTSDIQFSNCRFENFDRFGLFNCSRVTLTNMQMPSNYTRGLTMSPSCEDITFTGGIISGNAAHINANFACKRLVFSDLVAAGETTPQGQRHTLRCGYGTTDVVFSNITGFGNDVRHVFVEGCSNISFNNVNLKNWSGGNTTVAVSIAGGGSGNTSSWVTDKIRFNGCSFDSNYSLKFDDNAGTATIAEGAVTFDEGCRLNFGIGFVNGTDAPTKYKYFGSGTFTPFLVFSTSGGGAANTYSLQSGNYSIRNGKCHVDGAVTITAKDAAGVGNAQISGLPFTSKNTANRSTPFTISAWSALTFPANYTYLGASVGPNSSRLGLLRSGSAGVSAGNVAFAEVGAAFAIVFAGEYPIA